MTVPRLRQRLASLLSVREYLTARVQDGTITAAQAQSAGAMLAAQHWQGAAVLDEWACLGHERDGAVWRLSLVQLDEPRRVTAELQAGRGAHFMDTGADE